MVEQNEISITLLLDFIGLNNLARVPLYYPLLILWCSKVPHQKYLSEYFISGVSSIITATLYPKNSITLHLVKHKEMDILLLLGFIRLTQLVTVPLCCPVAVFWNSRIPHQIYFNIDFIYDIPDIITMTIHLKNVVLQVVLSNRIKLALHYCWVFIITRMIRVSLYFYLPPLWHYKHTIKWKLSIDFISDINDIIITTLHLYHTPCSHGT